MNASEVRNQLSLFLGLDDATIDQHVVPGLEGMKTRAGLQDYLTGLLGNDTAQAHFISAYANSRFPATSAPTKQQAPSSKPNKAPASTTNYSVPQQSRSNTKPSTSQQPAATPRHQSTAFPSQTSNAKLQIIQAPAVNVALPPSTRPSTSAFTLDHASAEAAAEAATKKLRQLELRLRAARGQSKERACFCQAQEHPLSPVIPICPQCLLVLCDVNTPFSRACPSCAYHPLVSDSTLASQIVQLEAEHAEISSKEKERQRLASEEEERARRAIQFPELQEGRSISPLGNNGSIDYARKLGGGPDHYAQVKQAYRIAQAKEEAIAAAGQRRVISLNSKTKKVQYQTTRPGNKNKAAAAAAIDGLNKQKKAAKVDELVDDRRPYIDENDDGLLKTGSRPITGNASVLEIGWPPKQGSGFTYVLSKDREIHTGAARASQDGAEIADED